MLLFYHLISLNVMNLDAQKNILHFSHSDNLKEHALERGWLEAGWLELVDLRTALRSLGRRKTMCAGIKRCG